MLLAAHRAVAIARSHERTVDLEFNAAARDNDFETATKAVRTGKKITRIAPR